MNIVTNESEHALSEAEPKTWARIEWIDRPVSTQEISSIFFLPYIYIFGTSLVSKTKSRNSLPALCRAKNFSAGFLPEILSFLPEPMEFLISSKNSPKSRFRPAELCQKQNKVILAENSAMKSRNYGFWKSYSFRAQNLKREGFRPMRLFRNRFCVDWEASRGHWMTSCGYRARSFFRPENGRFWPFLWRAELSQKSVLSLQTCTERLSFDQATALCPPFLSEAICDKINFRPFWQKCQKMQNFLPTSTGIFRTRYQK